MKKTYLNYEAPEVELVEMAVESGFAASYGSKNEDFDGEEEW